MRLAPRLPTFSSEGSWRKIFTKSSKHLQNEILAVSYSSTNVAIPPIAGPPAVAHTAYYPMATPRASSEYASSLGGPPEDNDFETPSSPVSATSSWNNSSIPESPTSSSGYAYSEPPRPMSLYYNRFHLTDEIEEEPATEVSAADPATRKQEKLVLTMTSKYPTGTAADMYTPVDVSMPYRPSVARRISQKVRPASMLLSRPSLPSRTSSRKKRTSVASASQLHW